MNIPFRSLLEAIRNRSGNQEGTDELAALKEHHARLNAQYLKLQQQNHWLSDLGQSTAQMLKQETVSTLLDHIASEVVYISRANGAYMHMVHETGDYLEVVAARGPMSERLLGQTRDRGNGLSARAWDTGDIQVAADYNNHPDCVLQLSEKIQAVALPLTYADTVLGVIFITASSHAMLEEDVALFEQIASIASLSIHHARQRETTERELTRTQSLSQLSSLMHHYQDWGDIAHHVCPQLFDVLDLSRVSLYQANASTHTIEPYCTWEIIDGNIERCEPVVNRLIQETISVWSYENKLPAQINRGVDDPRESAEVHRFRRERAIGSTLCETVMSEDTVWGLLTVCRHMSKRDFDENDVNIFRTVVGQMSTALQRHKLLLTVQHQALHDSLTKLPNRRGFECHILELLAEKGEGNSLSAVLFFDLDGFKDVNDTFGHATGDSVLGMVATRLAARLASRGFLARLGGDEFAVVLSDLKDDEQAVSIAQEMSSEFQAPFAVNDSELTLGTSIGISYYPFDGTSLDDLVKHADMAMYQAKRSGRNRIVRFDQQLAIASRTEHVRKTDLKKAVTDREFELWYQPQISLATNHVSGVEALIRWRHPTRGIVSPIDFIPLAEEIGLISSVGSWVLEHGCQQMVDWQGRETVSWHLGINVAAPQFMNKRFAENVLELLDVYRIAPEQLQLEVTESVFMNDLTTVLDNLKGLRRSGVRIAIDDFGTGYSSLKYLQELPLDVLKIDRAFISKLDNENMLDSLASTIVLLANRFGLETVAEGVETQEQLDLVRQLDCDLVQGYFFSKPVIATELPEVIANINEAAYCQRNCA